MFCTHCGLELQNTDRFCSQCGKGTGTTQTNTNQSGYYAPRRVYRLMYDKKLGGVCSGLAKAFDLDVTLTRILVFCFAVFTGVGVLGYIFAWIFMPKDYGANRPQQFHYQQQPT